MNARHIAAAGIAALALSCAGTPAHAAAPGTPFVAKGKVVRTWKPAHHAQVTWYAQGRVVRTWHPTPAQVWQPRTWKPATR